MIRDITLGQYYAGESPVHRLDPRTKIIGTLTFIVALFLVKSFWGFVLCAAFLGIVVTVSKVPLSFILRGLKPILIILALTFAINIFMIDGTEIWRWKFLKITVEGIRQALFMGIRLILLIISSSLLTLTTKPIALTDGLEKLMAPFAKIGAPAHEIAMMMSIALRFIPTLLQETDKIMKAQQARGADFESGNIIRRAKAMIPIIVPLFVSAFHIAMDLAMAMEARCYRGGKGRTRMNEIRFGKNDALAVLFLAALVGGVVLIRIFV
ncbi:MAG: energy-coupling factor transporter transmembrane protein EcfT [Eubacterium sp.]|nr:energy-coupling factor transporter transmembrane protein EcfT [Eubacterium sp.]MBR2559070.1 energy-coupling factor transporter transmembrane protein EcfT [Bacillota bacterium]